jgi:hypothetical protein
MVVRAMMTVPLAGGRTRGQRGSFLSRTTARPRAGEEQQQVALGPRATFTASRSRTFSGSPSAARRLCFTTCRFTLTSVQQPTRNHTGGRGATSHQMTDCEGAAQRNAARIPARTRRMHHHRRRRRRRRRRRHHH